MEEKLLDTLLQAYINQTEGISSSFSPQFIYNNKDREDPKKVFDCLKENLLQCKEFAFSVAFINDSGLNLLKQVLYELKNRFPQVKGRIITSNYLGFTEPKALHDLEKYDNIQVRMYYVSLDDKIGFHTKGYIFRFDNDDYKAVIGSSNITQSALTLNNEWNNLIVSKKEGKVMQNILSEYERMWKASLPLEEILSQYEQEYLVKKERRQVEETEKKGILAPNAMQQTFIKRLNDSISKKEKRGLLISATGTGKTYASAFGIRSIKEFKVNKILFVTHRETILSQAMETYKKVFQSEHKMALFSGTNHEIDGADFIFSTINTISDEKYYSQFKREEFDIVVIDECHRIGRETMYQKILSYFKPKYLLGMSATPDRNDGFDVYDVFDHNILYEIRLEDALEANMLVPFHYFGISDLSLQGQKQEIEDVRFLASEERVKLILSNSEYYGYSGERLKCLVFVSSIEEGVELEKKILAHGVKCRFLSGKDSSMERERCISLLEEEDASKNHLDMILTRDIFNEGVDIPSVNQVIFLRPTQSSIVFIQQLGRGLRLNKGKEYLTVIDFIANYESNYIIPQTFERKGAGQKRGERAIHPLTYGESVIQFDEVSTKRIIESYSKATNTDKKRIREQYHQIKSRLGRIPSLIEFDAQGSLSGRSFLDFYTHGYRSYYEFLFSEGEEKNHLSEVQRDTLIYASMAFGSFTVES